MPILAAYFIDRFCKELKKPLLRLSPQAEEVLNGYSWPGNVRELQNCIERAVILCDTAEIQPRHLSLASDQPGMGASTIDPWDLLNLSGTLAEASIRVHGEFEKHKLAEALREVNGDRVLAAQQLQIPRGHTPRETEAVSARLVGAAAIFGGYRWREGPARSPVLSTSLTIGRLTDRCWQHDVQLTTKDLLVATDRLHDSRSRQVAHRREWAKLRNHLLERGQVRFGEDAAPCRQARNGEHAEPNRLTVPKPPILRDGLDGVTDGVPEVEHAAQASLALVLRNHVCLDPTRLGDDRDERRWVSCEDRRQVSGESCEQIRAGDDAVFHDFVEPGPKLPSGERGEQLWVGNDHDRLVERPDEVLP